MKSRVVACFAVLSFIVVGQSSVARASSTLWNTGYYAGWMQDYLSPSEIDFSALTHVIHFAAIPRTDGSLDSATNVVTTAYSADITSRGHAAGVKVLISIGGQGSATAFRGATSAAKLQTFISNIVGFMTSRGYDGIDIDWEPLAATDASQFTALISGLRAALDAISPRPLLTVPVDREPALIASLQAELDQINLMTYSLSGPWSGWVTWFNSPLYDGGYRFPSTGALVPSTDGMLHSFLAAGVAASKLGVGVCFYGRAWNGGGGTPTGGATAPRQSWTTAPTAVALPYYSIMDNYSQSPFQYFWDAAAQSAYYAIDQSGSSNDKFISFDDEAAMQEKVEYAQAMGIGGVMIWELGGGYRANQPAGQRAPLLQALKAALGGGGSTPTPTPTIPAPTPTATPTPSSCSYSVSPTTQALAWKSSSASASVSTASGCGWSAASNASWLTVTSGSSGNGSGSVSYTATANQGSTARTGTISVGGQSITVTQSSKR